eukprot:18418-Rhodomonas_salina.3
MCAYQLVSSYTPITYMIVLSEGTWACGKRGLRNGALPEVDSHAGAAAGRHSDRRLLGFGRRIQQSVRARWAEAENNFLQQHKGARDHVVDLSLSRVDQAQVPRRRTGRGVRPDPYYLSTGHRIAAA